jgi:hypothetical protein
VTPAGQVTITAAALNTEFCIIAASLGTDANYVAAGPLSQSFHIAKGNQTINFAALANKTFGNPDFAVSATATSGLAVTFSVGAGDKCTISGSTVHITGAGSCTVTAAQTGNGNYNAATPVPRAFTIDKADTPTLTLLGAPIPVQVSDHIVLTPTAASSIATPTGKFQLAFGANGTITPAGGVASGTAFDYVVPSGTTPGNFTVTATFANDPNFKDGTKTLDVTVLPEAGSIKYNGGTFYIANSQGSATVALSAYVGDDPDGSPGDLRYARVSFIDRDSNQPLGTCKDVRIDVTDAAHPVTGIATCQYTVNLAKTETSQSLRVGSIVTYSHAINSLESDVEVQVTKAPAGSISGSAPLNAPDGTSMYPGTVSPSSSVSFEVVFNKSLTSLQGYANVIFTVAGRTYVAKGNSLSNLSVPTPANAQTCANIPSYSSGACATFLSKASIQDANTGASIDGNATIQLFLIDGGAPQTGNGDLVGIVITGKNGGVIYSNKLDVASGKPVMQSPVAGGNVLVNP